MRTRFSTTAVILETITPDKLQATHTDVQVFYGNGTEENPCIVQDTEDAISDIKFWRDFSSMKKVTNLDDNIWLSLSGIPSEQGWQQIAANIKVATKGQVNKIISLNLRRESHFYVGEQAVTLAVPKNWGNKDKNLAEILASESSWIQFLSDQGRVHVLSPKQFKNGHYQHGTTLTSPTIKHGRDIVEQAGLTYHRLSVPDHCAPSHDDVDAFVVLCAGLSKNDWLHINCKEGKGRSSTFGALYLILKYANQFSFEFIIKKIAEMPPHYDLSHTQHSYKESHRIERYQFIQLFYYFAQERLNGYRNTWSKWHADNSKEMLQKIDSDSNNKTATRQVKMDNSN